MAGKKRHFGRVRQLASGKWQARYPAPDGRDIPAPQTFERRRDAEGWLSDKEAELRRGDWIDPDAARISLTEYGQRWIRERDIARTTRERYEGLFRNHLDPALGSRSLGDISPAVVRTWRSDLLTNGIGRSTVAKAYRLLKSIMGTAVDDRLVGRNPCRIKGAGTEPTVERPVATVDQVCELAAVMPDRWRLVVWLATFASLRWGEMVGLRRDDFDLVARFVRIDEATGQLDSGELIDGDPKSEAGRRRVALPEIVIPEIKRHLEDFVGPRRDAYVFVGPKGARPRRSNFHVIWNRARVAVGVPELHLHDLRHTGNTWAAATPGTSLRDLMVRMGHASARAALIYQHAAAEHGVAMADAIGARFKGQRLSSGTQRARKASSKRRGKGSAA